MQDDEYEWSDFDKFKRFARSAEEWRKTLWTLGVMIVAHARTHGPTFDDIDNKKVIYDAEALVPIVREFIPLLLSWKKEEQDQLIPLVNPNGGEQNQEIIPTQREMMLWGLAVMLDPYVIDEKSGHNDPDHQHIKDYWHKMFKDLKEVDENGVPTNRTIEPERIEVLMEQMRSMVRTWDEKGMWMPDDVSINHLKGFLFPDRILLFSKPARKPRIYLDAMYNITARSFVKKFIMWLEKGPRNSRYEKEFLQKGKLKGKLKKNFTFSFYLDDWGLKALLTEMKKSDKATNLTLIDSAMTVTKNPQTPGGIDLNPNKMVLQTTGEDSPLYAPVDPAVLENMINIDGAYPVIINVSPVLNLRFLLGIADPNPQKEKPTEVSYNVNSLR